MTNNKGPCKIEGCIKKVHSRGLCGAHYQHWRKANSSATCSTEGCDTVAYAKGLCGKHYQLRRTKDKDIRTCETCGNSIEGMAARVRFCSDECKPRCKATDCQEPYYSRNGYCGRHEANFQSNGVAETETEWTPKADFYNCLACGVQFAHGEGFDRKFCCINHKNVWHKNDGEIPSLDYDCGVCGTHIEVDRWAETKPQKRIVCPECSVKLHRGEYRKKFTAEYLAERDGLECGICHEDVDLSIRGRASKSVSIDHVIPVSRGGTDDESNLRLSHFGCNSRRGNRLEVAAIPA